jgi:hypothetical protein
LCTAWGNRYQKYKNGKGVREKVGMEDVRFGEGVCESARCPGLFGASTSARWEMGDVAALLHVASVVLSLSTGVNNNNREERG